MHRVIANLSIFNPYDAPRFEFLSLAHIGAVTFIMVLLLVMFLYRQKLKHSESARKNAALYVTGRAGPVTADA